MKENIHRMILDRDVEIDKLKDKLLAANAENEILRETLKIIFNSDRSTNGPFTEFDVCEVCSPVMSKVREIAQAALEQTEGGA